MPGRATSSPTPRRSKLVIDVLGKQRTTEILKEIMDQVRREVKIGENEKNGRRRPATDTP
jgi:hypothetical protein